MYVIVRRKLLHFTPTLKTFNQWN